MMLIIGERINSSRKTINEAITKKDIKFIQQEAVSQVNAGADMIDVNCGTNVGKEKSDMEWLVKSVMEVVNAPLVIDSPDAAVLEHGLKVYTDLVKNKSGMTNKRPMINSITGETVRMNGILPLVKQYNTMVVALTMDESGMPHNAQQRFDVAKKVVTAAKEYGIPAEDIYFDCLVRPISTEPDQNKEFWDSIIMIKKGFPGVKTTCGLSNISFGLPNRHLINSYFFAISMYIGLDSAVVDITQKEMRQGLLIANALLNRDEFCLNYITGTREGKI